jgi:PadR family transcriptional regulator PadR
MQRNEIARLGEFEICVLSAIVDAGRHAYGAAIHNAVQAITSRDVAQGAVYTALMRLEDKGLVKSKLGEATAVRGGRPKRYYRIEAAGQQALGAALACMGRAARAVRAEA